jgi:carbonic anhydrase
MLQKYNNDLSAVTPKEALEILLAGNQRFMNGISVNKDLLSKVEMTGNSQKPFAAILSCMDSRAPVELLFDQGIGDVFSVRMAGNIISENVLGSLEYATGVVGSKLLMVMGHTNCGAVKGAIDKVELGNLTQLLDKIQPAVEGAKKEGEVCDSSNKAYVNAVAEQNVHNAKQAILDQSPIICNLVREGKIELVGAMYCVEKGSVTILEPAFVV